MNNFAILILSCDRYSGLWKPYFENFFSKWEDCNYPIYLLTNYKKCDNDMVRCISVGEDIDWSSNLKKALQTITEDYILTTFDDLFITNDIFSIDLEEIINDFKKYNMNYLSLSPNVNVRWNIKGEKYHIIPKGDFYRSSAVFSLWKKEVLYSLLKSGENAWEFELYGTDRTTQYGEWFAYYKRFFQFENLVIKGNIMLSALNKINVDMSYVDLPIVNNKKNRYLLLKERVFCYFWFFIPPWVRQSIHRIIHRL